MTNSKHLLANFDVTMANFYRPIISKKCFSGNQRAALPILANHRPRKKEHVLLGQLLAARKAGQFIHETLLTKIGQDQPILSTNKIG